MTPSRLNPLKHKSVAGEDRLTIRHPPAALVRRALAQAGILEVRIIGHPGCGKTELIEATLKRVSDPGRIAAIVVNPAASRDAARLRKMCGAVATVDAAVPTASAIWHALSDLNLDQTNIVLIGAAGGLAPLHDLGQDATVAVLAVSGGDDKAAEYKTLLGAASAVVLTKHDLFPHVHFDRQVFRRDVATINPLAQIYEVSASEGTGMTNWVQWLERQRPAKLRAQNQREHNEISPNFLG